MRILIVDKTFPEDIDIEREIAGPDAVFDIFTEGPKVTEEAWAAAEGVVVSRSSRLVTQRMEALRNCRVIVRTGVGYDGLDLKGFGARGVAVCNVPDYGTTEVADHAAALWLGLRRGVDSFQTLMRTDPVGQWIFPRPPCMARLRGTSVGVVGLGRIGTAFARRARAFDTEVVFYDPHLPEGTELATGYVRTRTLPELLERVDAVSLHTPLTEETHHLIDAAALRHMQPHAVLVTTARGPVVDLDALYEALRDDRLAGAGVDVFPTEPPDPNHPLIAAYRAREPWIAGRLLLSPHAAFFSQAAQLDLRRKGMETLVGRLRGDPPRNCVNRDHLVER